MSIRIKKLPKYKNPDSFYVVKSGCGAVYTAKIEDFTLITVEDNEGGEEEEVIAVTCPICDNHIKLKDAIKDHKNWKIPWRIMWPRLAKFLGLKKEIIPIALALKVNNDTRK